MTIGTILLTLRVLTRYFVECCSVWVFLILPIRLTLCIFGKNAAEVILFPSVCIIPGGTKYEYVLILVILTLITCLMWGLPAFSSIKLLFLLFKLINVCVLWGITLYYAYFCPLYFYPPILTYIFVCNNYYCCIKFSFTTIPSTIINQIYTERKSCPFSIYLIIWLYSFQYGLIDICL